MGGATGTDEPTTAAVAAAFGAGNAVALQRLRTAAFNADEESEWPLGSAPGMLQPVTTRSRAAGSILLLAAAG